jgi:aspartate racemase
MFVHLQDPADQNWTDDLHVHPFFVDSGGAKFDLTLFMQQASTGLTATIEYNTDLFDGATVERMLGHLQTLLEGLAADPRQRLSALPLLTEAERQRLLVAWNDTPAAVPEVPCIQALFEQQAERAPDDAAVVCAGEALTYRELNRRANQLAHYLRGQGVGPDTCVGVLVERSVDMAVGLLGILKAGGAYVPLDPLYPRERLAYILDDARVSILLAQDRLVGVLPGHTATVVRMDTDRPALERQPADNPAWNVTADHLAYVI